MIAESFVLNSSIACSRSRHPFHPTRSTPFHSFSQACTMGPSRGTGVLTPALLHGV